MTSKKEEVVEDKGAKGKRKFVQIAVRVPPEVHQRLADYVHELGRGLPPKERPSIDGVIQGAIAALLEGRIIANPADAVLCEVLVDEAPVATIQVRPDQLEAVKGLARLFASTNEMDLSLANWFKRQLSSGNQELSSE